VGASTHLFVEWLDRVGRDGATDPGSPVESRAVTAHRRPEIRFTDAPRGTCRWCGEGIVYADGPKRGEPDRRRRWHPECVSTYSASDPREVRRRLRRRDRGRCAACGLDTVKLRRELRGRGMTKKLRERGFVPRRSLWEVDHIVPLVDGGSHDLDNLQTLCSPCHRAKTAAEATERAAREREAAATQAPEVGVGAGAGAEVEVGAEAGADGSAAAADAAAAPLATAAPEAVPVPVPVPEPKPEPEPRPVPEPKPQPVRRGTQQEEPIDDLLARAGRLNERVESALRSLRARP